MTIAPFVDDPEDNRVYFRKLKDLSLDIQSNSIDNIDMSVLSMGMTNDYEVAVEEGAISKDDGQLTKKQYKAKVASRRYPSVSYEIADQIQEKCGVEVRVAVPGLTQRGGSPCPYDRVLCTRLGSAAAQAIMDGKFGCMIAMINNKTKCVPLGEVAGKLKTVDPDRQMIQEAKRIGISFGD